MIWQEQFKEKFPSLNLTLAPYTSGEIMEKCLDKQRVKDIIDKKEEEARKTQCDGGSECPFVDLKKELGLEVVDNNSV